jgi:RNA-directed DNA polymerase
MNWTPFDDDLAMPEEAASAPATYRQISEPANLIKAWERVRRNQGCAGVDRQSIMELEPQFPELARRLSEALRRGHYAPRPLRRAEIPKPSGGVRKLGIPSVLDRVVQQASVQVLQPLFEPRFSPCSFAYRPGRGPLDAVNHVRARLARASWVLHLDIEDFFDSVPHGQALDALRPVASEPPTLRLVEQVLTCGVFEDGRVVPTTAGLPQGSPLSPLLANAVLDRLDGWLEARGALFARYADDSVVLCDSAAEAERCRNEIASFLTTLGLALNLEKTAVTPAEQAEFLSYGFAFTSAGECLRRIAPGALTDLAAAIGARAQAAGDDPETMTRTAAELWRSWLGYFAATELPRDRHEAWAVACEAVRRTIWAAWRPEARRASELRRRGIPLGDTTAPDPQHMLQAFPDSWFAERGLRADAEPDPGRTGGADYNGRFAGTGGPSSFPSPSLWPDTLKCWGWSLLRSGWLRVGLEMGRAPRRWFPLPRGVRLHLGGHYIVCRF